jgi:hypothetical protein
MSWNIPNFFSQFGSFTTSSRFFLDGWTLESSVGTWGNEGLASILPGSNPPQFVTVPYRYPRAAGFLSAYVIIKIGSSNAALSNISRIDWYGVATVHGTNRNARRVNVYTSNIELTVNSPFQGTFRGSFDVDINSNFSSPSSFHSNMSFNWIYFEVVSNWGDRDTTKVDRIEFIGGSSNSFTTTVSTNNGTFYQSGSSFLFRASSTVAQSESSIITSSNQGESWNQNLQSVRTNGNAWVFISTAKNNFRRVFAYNLGLFNLFTSAISGESCRVSGAVRSSDRISSSDKRIKMNTHAIDANTSSDIIKVHPKKYQFISQNKPIIGFIAQDVDSIYPQAVQIMPKIIPNFMSHVVISHHSNHIFKVMNAIHSNQFKFISNAPLENQRYKIQFKDIQTNNHFYAWTAGDGIFEKHFFIEINDPNFIPGLYVLIGQEINDCHTLNADALFSIKIAHIQKMVDKQKTENNRISLLKNKYVSLQKLIEKQNELIDALVK